MMPIWVSRLTVSTVRATKPVNWPVSAQARLVPTSTGVSEMPRRLGRLAGQLL